MINQTLTFDFHVKHFRFANQPNKVFFMIFCLIQLIRQEYKLN